MERFEERQHVEFTHEGEKIFGILHCPIGAEKVPAVIFCHGLAGHKIGKHRMYVSLAESLSRHGIASFRFDFRGSGDSEGSFSDMSLKGEVSDALRSLEYLVSHPQIDHERIGIFGRSFGGAVAVMAAHRYKKAKTMALWAPVFNAKQWEEQWELYETHQLDEETRHNLMRINGQLPSIDFYKDLFLMDIANELSSLDHVPMLLIHGETDPLISIEHSNQYWSLRKNAAAKTEFIKLTHSDHDFSHPEEKLLAIQTTAEWFSKTL